MPDVFLSYSRDDHPTARRFAEGLEREGFSVWWDQALDVGEAFDQVTEKALGEARAVVVLWSKHSVDSRWVRAEATQAQADHRLAPVMIEPCKRPIMFELTQTVDLSGWNGDPADARWRGFVDSLRRFIGKGATSPTGVWSATAGAAAAALPPPPPRRWPGWAAAAVAALALAAGLFWYLQGRQSASAAGREISIAVLPFDDMSENRDQGHLADGIAEEILNSLANLPDLRVTARTSSFAFKGRSEDLRAIARTLDVGHVLEGSVRRSGDQLRINAQLIQAGTGYRLWSETYNRPRTDIFAVQEDIATNVARALQVTLGVGLGGRRGMTRNVEAYEAWLEAQSHMGQFTPDAFQRAIVLLERAVALDPEFAMAWLGLVNAAGGMGLVAGGGNPTSAQARDWDEKAAAAAARLEKLMQGTPGLLARNARRAGRTRVEVARNYEAAASEAAKLGLDWDERGPPGFLLEVGRIREAIEVLERERARDPLNAELARTLGEAYAFAGRFREAFAELERADGLGADTQLGVRSTGVSIALGARDMTQLRRWVDASAEVVQDPAASLFTKRIRELLDRPAEALAYLHEMARNPDNSALTQSVIAQYLLFFGDVDGALQLHLPGTEVSAVVLLSGWHPVNRQIRRLPRFKQWMLAGGFVDYWNAYRWADLCRQVDEADFECD